MFYYFLESIRQIDREQYDLTFGNATYLTARHFAEHPDTIWGIQDGVLSNRLCDHLGITRKVIQPLTVNSFAATQLFIPQRVSGIQEFVWQRIFVD